MLGDISIPSSVPREVKNELYFIETTKAERTNVMSRMKWILFAVICVVVLGGLTWFAKKDSVDVSSLDPAKVVAADDKSIGDQVYGKKDAKVVVVEYGDFQCPGCGGAFPQLKTIKETYKDSIAFVFRNFPLTNIHPNALAAATAAEAAGLQGKFWEMHDKLYESQSAWSDTDSSKRTDVFAGYAQDIGLNVEQFRRDLSDPKISDKIRRDQGLAKKVGADSTPTITVGGEKVSSDVTSDLVNAKGEKLTGLIDAALKAAGVELPSRP